MSSRKSMPLSLTMVLTCLTGSAPDDGAARPASGDGWTGLASTDELTGANAADQWKPAAGPLMTRWAKDVSPQRVHPEYPRPQMVRKEWRSLNGLWDYAITPRDEANKPNAAGALPGPAVRAVPGPAEYAGKILVPFPIESALSGVMQRVEPDQRLWYRRTFEIPPEWRGDGAGGAGTRGGSADREPPRVLLHFGAVDWETIVWINGREVGRHRGGYDPFAFDITDALNATGPQEIVVSVWDPTDAGPQPRGKQVRKPEGIWYTPTTGIWQTVWLEPVPAAHVERVQITPMLEHSAVNVRVEWQAGAGALTVQAEVLDGQTSIQRGEVTFTGAAGARRTSLLLPVPESKRWSPDVPFLYGLKIGLVHDGQMVDSVESYFGMREVSIGRDGDGPLRIRLNGRPLFLLGPLDQGFWPDGLYTAPSDDALRYDLEVLKRLGFNAVRKHVKVEPDRWYYWCDKLGLAVLQDMPSGDAFPERGEREIERTTESAEQFEAELKAMIDSLRNHPSIIMWVPFNEGWGQYETERIAEWVKSHDPTRLVDCASGWNDFPVGEVRDIHAYPGPAAPPAEEKRAALLGEFGGRGLPLAGHTWQAEKNWGYRTFGSQAELTEAYVQLIDRLRFLAAAGLSGAIYTQTSDVEIEVNGLMTYDRAVLKVDEALVAAAHRRLFARPPQIRTLLAASREAGHAWRYTTAAPPDGWEKPGFDDSDWQRGEAGFGRLETPGAVVRTEWVTSDIWLRRMGELLERPRGEPHLLVHHDEDAEVFINGVPAATLKGYTTGYVYVPISAAAREDVRRGGRVVLAVHCRQTAGGQYIDVGIVDVVEAGQATGAVP